MSNQQQVDMLLDVLLQNKYRSLFHESAEFHYGITLMARSLPRIVEIMADEAMQADTLRRRLLEDMSLRPGPGLRP